jgi:hypothetical protein
VFNLVVAVSVGFFLLCIVGWAWRINMILNDPEKYKRLRAAEKEHQDRQMEIAGKAAKGGTKAALWLIKLWLKK